MHSLCAITEKMILSQIQAENIQFIECNFTDITGTLREITIPAHYMASALEDGIKFDGSSIPGCTSITQSDMLLKPDISTFALVPTSLSSTKTARVLCSIYVTKETPFDGDPRFILQKALREAHDLGYEFLVGPELEFFIFDKDTHTPCDSKNYFDTQKNTSLKCFTRELMQVLADQGIGIEKIHHEVAHGQYEMSLHYCDALKMADHVLIAKHSMAMLADRYGYTITFMPKPIYGQNGSALHLNFSLHNLETNKNSFYDAQDPAYLSCIAKQFIAGVLDHSIEMTAVFNQTINSYKRLVRGYEAPIYCCWGQRNRSALIRIPQINQNQAYAIRGEIRSPDSLCNPYLAFACLLQAGLEGIKNNDQLEPAMEENLYTLSEAELEEHTIKPLPYSLESALACTMQSELISRLFGKTALAEFVKYKNREIQEYNTIITHWELNRYL